MYQGYIILLQTWVPWSQPYLSVFAKRNFILLVLFCSGHNWILLALSLLYDFLIHWSFSTFQFFSIEFLSPFNIASRYILCPLKMTEMSSLIYMLYHSSPWLPRRVNHAVSPWHVCRLHCEMDSVNTFATLDQNESLHLVYHLNSELFHL